MGEVKLHRPEPPRDRTYNRNGHCLMFSVSYGRALMSHKTLTSDLIKLELAWRQFKRIPNIEASSKLPTMKAKPKKKTYFNAEMPKDVKTPHWIGVTPIKVIPLS